MDVGDANMELKDFVEVEATFKGVGNMVLTYSTLKVVLVDDVDTILKDYGIVEIMHIDVPFTIIHVGMLEDGFETMFSGVENLVEMRDASYERKKII
jgi:hypothetical protein